MSYDPPAILVTASDLTPKVEDTGTLRKFETGATRDTGKGKLCYEGFLSPIVLKRFAQYMHKHCVQKDGTPRAPDNWQAGLPKTVYIDSGLRHFMDWWMLHRGYTIDEPYDIEEVLCALLFNVQGYLHEHLKSKLPIK